MTETLLEADAITAGFRDAPAVLRDATIRITRGHLLALMGSNGSGKTTLLRCLSGAHEPSAGQVLRGGRALRYKRADLNEHRQHVQLVLQDPDDQLFSADVRADISFGPMNLGLGEDEVRSRVEQTLTLLNIVELAERPVHQLSYGQRKRVAIAGAVAMRPDVLLLDEPTAGLDPAGVSLFHDLLQRLVDAGTTVVLATHDVDLAWRLVDEVAVVHDASVVQGVPGAVLTDDALLARAGLELPWQVDLARRVGLPLDPARRPRTAADVATLLKERGQR